MNRLPWFPFYHVDFETSPRVKQMGPVARCYYLTLLSHQWQEGSIPEDRQAISRILNMPDDRLSNGYLEYLTDTVHEPYLDLKSTLDMVLACFKSNGRGRLVNERMEIVRRYHANVHAAQSKGAKESWNRRRNNNFQGSHKVTLSSPQGDLKATSQVVETLDDTKKFELTPPNDHPVEVREKESIKEREKEKRSFLSEKEKNQKKGARKRKSLAAVSFLLPGWIPSDSWSAFVEMRLRIRKPMTDRAKELACMELERLKAQGQDPTAVLNQSVMNSWQGLFPLKGGEYHHGRNAIQQNLGDINRKTGEEVLRRAAERDRKNSNGGLNSPG